MMSNPLTPRDLADAIWRQRCALQVALDRERALGMALALPILREATYPHTGIALAAAQWLQAQARGA